jgi:hypothetical protein
MWDGDVGWGIADWGLGIGDWGKMELLLCFDRKPGFNGHHQGFLAGGFGCKGFYDFFVDGVFGDQVIHIDWPGLALAMETGIGLLVEFEAPIHTEPDHIIANVLEIEAVGGGGGMSE